MDPFAALYEPHRYKVFFGGRGSGKSWAVARALIAFADYGNTRILCCREIQNSIRDSSYQILKDTAFRMNVAGHFEFKESEIVNARTGSKIIFSGLLRNENSIRSKEGIDICWVEEASSVSRKSWDTLVPTIRKPGSEIWLTFNPLTVDDPTNDFIENPPPDAYVRKVNFSENPHFPEVLRAQMEWDRANDYEKYLHVWEGYPLTISDAQIFKGHYAVEPIPDDLWKSADRLFFGADFGFARDPSTLVRCFILGNTLYIDYEAYGVGVEIDELPQLYRSVPGADSWPIKGDAARPETISYLRRAGFDITAADKWQGSIEEGINFLKSFDRIVIDPRCKHAADEFRLYSYKTDRLTSEVLPVVLDKNNHCIAEGEKVETARGSVPIEDVRVGDLVLTRFGYREVLFSGETGNNRLVHRIITDSHSVKCTAEHRIYVLGRGFIEARDIRVGDVLVCLKSKESNTTGSAGTGIRIPNAGATACISSGLSPAELSGFIDMSGRSSSERSRKALTFTTKTETPSTTIRQTSPVCLPASIGTSIRVPKNSGNGAGSVCVMIESKTRRELGTQARPGSNGIPTTPAHSTSVISTCLSEPATSAGRHSSRRLIMSASAPMPANPHGDVTQESTTSRSPASGAGNSSPATSTQSTVFAVEVVRANTVLPCTAKRVYDLTVDGAHEFFAGGILVHNCIDGLRYGLVDHIKARGYGFRIAQEEIENTDPLWV